ncbi:LytR C-terminal domain-containing protein [Nocardia sp. 004]|uniref:LytR C-terminal domain-containing protein n=1 Tax=Nocardia sp. 004 TaxID=3385978 RepID=UPI0039A1E587
MSYPNPTSGGPPLRALAMVLIALAIVFAVLGAMSLSNSDADVSDASGTGSASATTRSATSSVVATTSVAASAPPPEVPTAVTPSAPAAPAAGRAVRSVPVRVLNNSLITGLAAKTADRLSASGWTIAETGNFSSTNIPETTVFYGSSPVEEEAARAIAAELGAVVAPKSGVVGSSGAGVTVIVTGN